MVATVKASTNRFGEGSSTSEPEYPGQEEAMERKYGNEYSAACHSKGVMAERSCGTTPYNNVWRDPTHAPARKIGAGLQQKQKLTIQSGSTSFPRNCLGRRRRCP